MVLIKSASSLSLNLCTLAHSTTIDCDDLQLCLHVMGHTTISGDLDQTQRALSNCRCALDLQPRAMDAASTRLMVNVAGLIAREIEGLAGADYDIPKQPKVSIVKLTYVVVPNLLPCIWTTSTSSQRAQLSNPHLLSCPTCCIASGQHPQAAKGHCFQVCVCCHDQAAKANVGHDELYRPLLTGKNWCFWQTQETHR